MAKLVHKWPRKGVSDATFDGKKHQPKFKGQTLILSHLQDGWSIGSTPSLHAAHGEPLLEGLPGPDLGQDALQGQGALRPCPDGAVQGDLRGRGGLRGLPGLVARLARRRVPLPLAPLRPAGLQGRKTGSHSTNEGKIKLNANWPNRIFP